MSRTLDRPNSARTLVPWLALAGLWLLFEIPMTLAPDRVALGALRPTGEMLAILTVLATSYRLRRGRVVRWLLGAFVTVLVVVRVDRALFFVLARTEPLLYDQLFLVRHLLVLLNDLWSWRIAPSLTVMAIVVVLTIAGVRYLVRRMKPLFEPPRLRAAMIFVTVSWLLVLGATVFGPRPPNRPWVRWMLPDLARNIVESKRIWNAVRTGISESPYRRYDALTLSQKPDVLFFFVESYGKLIAEHPAMRPIWVDTLHGVEERLTTSGWQMASAYATAPVSGGRSWLAVGSILMGTSIQYESVFHHLTEGQNRLPTLVDFFSKQGYETVNLAPSDRRRPGIEDDNRYRYDRYLRFDDLAYRGPRMGWGIVPDQYALGYADEHVLSSVKRPLFLNFHMVSSHAAWTTVPSFLSDWRLANTGQEIPASLVNDDEIVEGIGSYSREERRQPYMGALTCSFREGYERAILYDLRVIEEYLAHRSRDALVIVMGDHQPPVVAPETESFDVPVHVFARDPKLLDEFLERGFSPGLVLPRDKRPSVQHAGLFSLVVRALARCCSASGVLPPYLETGMKLGD